MATKRNMERASDLLGQARASFIQCDIAEALAAAEARVRQQEVEPLRAENDRLRKALRLEDDSETPAGCLKEAEEGSGDADV